MLRFYLYPFFIHYTDFYTFAPIFIHKFQLAARGCARPVFCLRIPWLYFYAKTACIYTTYTIPKFLPIWMEKRLDKLGFIMYNLIRKREREIHK